MPIQADEIQSTIQSIGSYELTSTNYLDKAVDILVQLTDQDISVVNRTLALIQSFV
jgi:hypothetical protein